MDPLIYSSSSTYEVGFVTGSDYVITLNLICPVLKMGIIITPSKFYRAVMNEIKTSS